MLNTRNHGGACTIMPVPGTRWLHERSLTITWRQGIIGHARSISETTCDQYKVFARLTPHQVRRAHSKSAVIKCVAERHQCG
jgi:hypothetical protein